MKSLHDALDGRWWLLVLLAIIAVVILYSSPFVASDLNIVPDSTEYALSAHRFAATGEYRILVDGRWLPPHYPPWFSAFVLAPAYRVLGPEIGNAIVPVTLFGVVGVLLAFVLGERVNEIVGACENGTRVLFDTASVTVEDQPVADALGSRFLFVPVTGTLFELSCRE